MYNILDEEGYESDSGTEGTIMTQTAPPTTQTAAMTTGSTLTNTYGGGNNPFGNNQRHQPTLGESADNDDSNGSNVIQQCTRATTPNSSKLPCSPNPTVEHSPFRWPSEYRLQCRNRE